MNKEDHKHEHLKFLVNTLQEFDNVEPHGLDIILEYKANDREFQAEESKQLAR